MVLNATLHPYNSCITISNIDRSHSLYYTNDGVATYEIETSLANYKA